LTPLRRVGVAGAAAALVLALLIAFFAPRRNVVPMAALRGTPVEPPRTARDFVLTDANGSPAHIVDGRYALTFLFFGYTHCPDACPLAMASLGRAYRKLSHAQASRTRVVFVSVDPNRDTPLVVRRYVTGFDSHFAGLTGSADALARVWHAYGIGIDARSREIAHGDEIYAIDDRARVLLEYPPDVAAADLASDAAVLSAR
jgi:protein SCO1/2